MRYIFETFKKFNIFGTEVEKQLGKSIQILRFNRGDENLSQESQKYLEENGILSRWTPPYTHHN